jgi:hypothetical protein
MLPTTTIYTLDLSHDEIKQLISDAEGTVDLRPSNITTMPSNLFNSISTSVNQIWLPNLEGVDVQDGAFNGLENVSIIVQTQEDGQILLNKGVTSMLTVGDLETTILPTTPMLSGGVGADPYVFPIEGPNLKLPDVTAMYRMYQHRTAQVFVDIHVGHRVVEFSTPPKCLEDGSKVVAGGFYITRLSCHDRKSTGSWSLDVTNADCFNDPNLPWTDTGVCSASSVLGGILHGSYRSRTLWAGTTARVEVRIYDNPQILNAFVLYVPPQADGEIDGLVYRNYKPKQYVSSGKRLHRPFIHRKPGSPLTCSKTIVGRGEIPSSVTQPCLFGAMFR